MARQVLQVNKKTEDCLNFPEIDEEDIKKQFKGVKEIDLHQCEEVLIFANSQELSIFKCRIFDFAMSFHPVQHYSVQLKSTKNLSGLYF